YHSPSHAAPSAADQEPSAPATDQQPQDAAAQSGGAPDPQNQDAAPEQPARHPAVVYSLTLRLGRDADPEAAACESYDDGVLVLNVPRAAARAPRKLAVH
ncbi:MAG: hypothetical protein AAGE99_06135, partial [Chlamydiota bacterium]